MVSLPALDRQALNNRWFQALDSGGVTVHARTVGREQLPRWIAGRLAAQEQSADPETLEFIADRVEGNLMAAFQEVQKLALLLGPGKIAIEAVKQAVVDVARYDVFELGPTLLRGDRAHFVRVLDGVRAEGTAAPLVLWVIAEEVRSMARVAAMTADGMPQAQAMKAARVWGARQQLMPRALARLSQSRLFGALEQAAAIDRQIKGLAVGDPWDALLALGLALMPPPAAGLRATNGGRISRSA